MSKPKRPQEVKTETGGPGRPRYRVALNVALGALLLGVLAFWLFVWLAEPGPQLEPMSTPEPYEYDEQRDRYWHPGHGHWHDGRPPEGAQPEG